jgi:hypothetical protein
VKPGEGVLVGSAAIEFPEGGIEVEIGRARVWDSRLEPLVEAPDHPAGNYAVQLEQLGERPGCTVSILGEMPLGRETASPFLTAVLNSDAMNTGADLSGECIPGDIVRAKARRLVSRLRRAWTGGRTDMRDRGGNGESDRVWHGWTDHGDDGHARGILSELVGFGPGLTPSGDDFLLGLLGADRLFGSAAGGRCDARFMREVRCHLPALLRSAGSTTTQSCLMLEAALMGHFPAPVSRLLASLERRDEEEIRESVARLRKIGASSGEDILAGIIFWLDARDRCGKS